MILLHLLPNFDYNAAGRQVSLLAPILRAMNRLDVQVAALGPDGPFAEPLRARRLGVAPGYPTTLAALGAVRERLTRPHGRWPGAEELVRGLVTLPTHSLVSAAERDEMLRLLE